MEAILRQESVSLEAVGEDKKVDELKLALRMINMNVRCGEQYVPGGKILKVTIPPMGVEAMRQRTIQALEQCELDIQLQQPPQQHHENPSPK
jgi:hypothetical protein